MSDDNDNDASIEEFKINLKEGESVLNLNTLV